MSAGRYSRIANHARLGVIALTALVLSAGGSLSSDVFAGDDKEQLAADQLERIRTQIVPAYRAGRSDLAYESLRGLLPRLNEERVKLVDHELISNDLPTVEQLLAESWMDHILDSAEDPVYIRLPLELSLTLNGLNRHVARTLNQVSRHKVNQDPLGPPEEFEKYERLFWDVHVMNNLLNNAEQIATYAGELAELTKKRAAEDRFQGEARQALDRDYKELTSQVTIARQKLIERSIELRIYRLEDAYNALKNKESAKDQILAAFVVESDGTQLKRFFDSIRDQPNGAMHRRSLNEPGLEESVTQMVEEVRSESPDMIKKGQLLFAGLHWWMRGRYGSGVDFYGLLKSPVAMRNPNARFPLYMPIKRPKPTDPMLDQGYSAPPYDRRHHYTWAYKDRKIQIDTENYSSSYDTKEVVDVNKSNEPYFW